MTDRIRQILADHARLNVPVDALGEVDDLYQAGMSSHASVQVMLALEHEFDIEFPEAMFRRSVFASVASMSAAVGHLTSEAAAA